MALGRSVRFGEGGGVRPALSIVIPTIKGREAWLERTLDAFQRLTESTYEVLVEYDHPGCGPAWQAGGDASLGNYIFTAADDLEPASVGWEQVAMRVCDAGALPAPRIYNSDGTVQSCGGSWGELEPDGRATEFTRAPFMSRAQWMTVQPMLPCHYFTDNWVSWRGQQHGIPTRVAWGFDLIHHLAQEGRNESRMGADMNVFARARQGEDVWATGS